MRVNFTQSATNIVLFYNNRIFNIPYTFARFNELKEHLKLKEHDAEFIESIVDIPKQIERASAGNVKVLGNSVYYKGSLIKDVLAVKLVDMLNDGFDITPWINFMNKIMENPSDDSRNSLFRFLERNMTPIHEDGDFIAFKRIRKDWLDIHSGTMLNKPGMIVEMPREAVNPNNDETCSTGLHVAASIYLNSFANAYDSRTITVKVNPKDVVAVPSDYNETKMRVCRYEVLDEVEIGDIKGIETSTVIFTPVAESNDDYYTPQSSGANGIDTSNDYDWNPVQKVAAFIRSYDGKEFTVKEILDGVAAFGGVTAWANSVGIARSTAQGWVKKIINNNLGSFKPTPVVEEEKETEVENVKQNDSWFTTTKGETFSVSDIINGIKNAGGVTAWAKLEGIARSTAQGWAKKITNMSFENTPLTNTKESNTVVEEVADNTQLSFIRDGKVYLEKDILEGVKLCNGVTGWAKANNIPRSTAQDWIKKILNK